MASALKASTRSLACPLQLHKPQQVLNPSSTHLFGRRRTFATSSPSHWIQSTAERPNVLGSLIQNGNKLERRQSSGILKSGKMGGASVSKRCLSLNFGSGDKNSGAQPSATQPYSKEKPPMPWPTYFQLRRSRRFWGIYTTIPSTLGAGTIALSTVGSLEANALDQIFGVEGLIVYGCATVLITLVGYLLGPAIGTTLWRTLRRKHLEEGKMDVMDREFYKHVVKNRVDPSRQSVNNPVPDYYGEKISSLRGYRQWLRDQNVYRRKASFGSEEPL